MDPRHTSRVARIFDESDRTDLPHLIGVAQRTLFTFHGLYFHLVDATKDVAESAPIRRNHPLFADVSTRLNEFITPYDPGWEKPQDAMAQPFYNWRPS